MMQTPLQSNGGYGKRPIYVRPDIFDANHPTQPEEWINQIIEEEKENRSFWTLMVESKLIVLFYLIIICMVLCIFLCLVKKLKSINDDDDISDVET